MSTRTKRKIEPLVIAYCSGWVVILAHLSQSRADLMRHLHTPDLK